MGDSQVEKSISDFRAKLLMKMPFYGEILSRVDIAESNSIETVGTNGRAIFYNRGYFEKLNGSELNYILMHELLHIILLHFRREKTKEREIWNVASDYIANALLDPLVIDDTWVAKRNYGIEFKRPADGHYLERYKGESVEQLYKRIYIDNSNNKKRKSMLLLQGDYSGLYGHKPASVKLTPNSFDLIMENDEQESVQIKEGIQKLTDEARKKWSNDPSIQLIKRELNILENEKRISWKQLLKRFLNDTEYSDVSYDTPERKYIHMDLILPGEGKASKRSELRGVWAFIDTSGSISATEMNMFITELYRLCKQYDSKLNIGFWDTAMHEVYENIKQEDIRNCTTKYCGGTDVGAVYSYVKENNIKPHVMLILTDGYFNRIPHFMVEPYRKKTIVVLSNKYSNIDEYLGQVARFEDK